MNVVVVMLLIVMVRWVFLLMKVSVCWIVDGVVFCWMGCVDVLLNVVGNVESVIIRVCCFNLVMRRGFVCVFFMVFLM